MAAGMEIQHSKHSRDLHFSAFLCSALYLKSHLPKSAGILWWSPLEVPASPYVLWRPQQPGMAETRIAVFSVHGTQLTCPPQKVHPYLGWQWCPGGIYSPRKNKRAPSKYIPLIWTKIQGLISLYIHTELCTNHFSTLLYKWNKRVEVKLHI